MVRIARALAATGLNFIAPGCGHLYVGRAARFMVPAAGFLLLSSGLAIFGGMSTFYGMAVYLVLLLALILYGLIDAFVIGLRTVPVGAKWYGRWYALIGWFLLLLAIGVALPLVRKPVFGYSVFRAPSESMSPTIERGDTFLVDTRAYVRRGPEIGQLAVLRSPANGLIYVRRISALPTAGTVSFTSDNPGGRSTDSDLRSVPLENVIGRVTDILYSNDFQRIGKAVR